MLLLWLWVCYNTVSKRVHITVDLQRYLQIKKESVCVCVCGCDALTQSVITLFGCCGAKSKHIQERLKGMQRGESLEIVICFDNNRRRPAQR